MLGDAAAAPVERRYGAAMTGARRRTETVRVLAAACSVSIAGCADGSSVSSGRETASATSLTVVDVEAQACARPQPRLGIATRVGDNVFLTAAHVVDGDLRALTVNGAPAHVVALDERLDVALVASTEADLPAPESWTGILSADDMSTPVEPGPVTIHRPDGVLETRLNRSLTLRVDDVTRGVIHERPALELDVVVDLGDSGAPVVDADGRMIGVVVLSRAPAGVSYATRLSPSENVSDVADDQGRSTIVTGPTMLASVAQSMGCT